MNQAQETTFLKNKDPFNQNLHQWYKIYHRKLPWRTQPSLYKTVVSEFMLQQTQVDTALPYFDRWLQVFPDFTSLAKAQEEQVVKQWEGLGYYSRARNLHKLAQQLTQLNEIPTTLQAWLQFPGVGPYTAAAITSIAFNQPNAVVDGNVIRILTRLTGNKTAFKDNSSAVKTLSPLANSLLHTSDPNTHNQAMMELGATLCVRANPMCTICPVVNFCLASKQGIAEQLPNIARKKIERILIQRIWLIHNEQILLTRIADNARRLANIYELPEANSSFHPFLPIKPWAVRKRGISNQQIEEHIHKLITPPSILATIQTQNNLEWVPLKNLPQITLSGPHKRWINELLPEANNDSIIPN